MTWRGGGGRVDRKGEGGKQERRREGARRSPLADHLLQKVGVGSAHGMVFAPAARRPRARKWEGRGERRKGGLA